MKSVWFQRFVICVLFASVIFTNCKQEDLVPDLSTQIEMRSCAAISSSWLNELKTLAAVHYETPPSALSVSAIELNGASSYTCLPSSALVAKVPLSASGFLFLVTNGSYDGSIVGYYELTTFDFCGVLNGNRLVIGELDDIAFNTLGIIAVDQDGF